MEGPRQRQRKSQLNVNDQDSKTKTSNSVNKFHWDLWVLLTLENWVFDFGRPIFALFIGQDVFPMKYPSVGDYCHMAYNLITPFCLLKLFERSKNKTSQNFNIFCVIIFVMGASIHLVGDSVNHRLVKLGYELHLSVRENQMMQKLEPRGLVESFELLYLYDEIIGHLMWYIPFFICVCSYFTGCFISKSVKSESLGLAWWMLTLSSGLYFWYLVTEGQIFTVYFLAFLFMAVVAIRKSTKNEIMDANGRFLFYSFLTALVLVVAWVGYLWNDEQLRHKYPGLLYIPEPWSYYTLYLV